MKKLVTLVMIAAATTFAMTSCGGEDAANAFTDAMENMAEDAADAVDETVTPVEEPVMDEVPAEVDTNAVSADDVPVEEPTETTEH